MEFAKRKSPRIPGYTYSTPNYYFITICTAEKECIFGKPDKLNACGEFADECIRKIPELNPKIKLDKYVIMPNHIHGIFIVQAEDNQKGLNDLSVVLGQYKMSVTKRIRQLKPGKKVWQRSFHDHVIRSQKGYERIWMYIEHNPQKWEEDCFYRKQEDIC